MKKLHGSYNSRFFVIRLPGELRLHRGSPQIWATAIDDEVAGDLVMLSNSGDMFFRGPRGVYRLRKQKGVLEPIRTLTNLAQGEEGAYLGGVRVSVDGKEFCYERIAPESRLSDKLFRLLRTGPGEAKALGHQLFLYNTAAGNAANFYSALVDPARSDRFLWAISPSFKYLLVSQPDRRGHLLFQVIDILDEALMSEFEMRVRDITSVIINDGGTAGLEVRRPGDEKLVVCRLNGARHLVNLSPGARIVHLGKDIVAMQTQPTPFLIVKDYNDSLRVNADLRPLHELGVEYLISFNERGDIDLISYKDEMLHVQHTDIQSLPTDAKRWQMMACQKQLDDEERIVREATSVQEEQKRHLDTLEKSRLLAETMRLEVREEPPPAPRELPIPGPAEIPTPKPVLPPAPPVRLEIPGVGRPTPPKQIELPATEIELPAIGTPAASTSPPPAPPPPPVTEDVALELAVPDRGGALSPGDVDEQLERLRMRYIAGEIGRDDYYKQRGELEKIRKEGRKLGRPAAPGESGPARLDIDVEPPVKDKPPVPPALPGRRIELGRTLERDGERGSP